VFQAVCLILLEKLESVRTPRGLAAWIITTTTRECLALVRKQRREQGRAAGDGSLEAAVQLIDPQRLPEEEVLSLERQHVVRTAISQLPENCRRLVGAFFSTLLTAGFLSAARRQPGRTHEQRGAYSRPLPRTTAPSPERRRLPTLDVSWY